jgi:uncharacterized membrane protein (UPF0127 family)
MLRASLKKIKSAPKLSTLFTGGLVVFVVVCVLLIGGLHQKSTANTRLLRVGQNYYQLEEVTTLPAQEQGLGSRVAMDADRGMLFTYTRDDQRCFWMKDMHFSLDIIWVDHVHNVTHIEPHLAPSTYPQTYCATGQYVIELSSGEAAKDRLEAGQNLNF